MANEKDKASTSDTGGVPPALPNEEEQSRENVAAAKIEMQSFFNNDCGLFCWRRNLKREECAWIKPSIMR